MPLKEENIVLGFLNDCENNVILNYCIILAKFYIYTCKREDKMLFFLSYLSYLKDKLVVKKFISTESGKEKLFYTVCYLYEAL